MQFFVGGTYHPNRPDKISYPKILTPGWLQEPRALIEPVKITNLQTKTTYNSTLKVCDSCSHPGGDIFGQENLVEIKTFAIPSCYV